MFLFSLVSDLYVVEFQKRGLPHTHTLIWLKRNTKEPSASLIDRFVSAELPDPKVDPLGYALVDEFMVHGPCGDLNQNCPCMKNGSCSKLFPKVFNDETVVDEKGFPIYRRRADGRFVYRNKGTTRIDNKWVVPHNLDLLKRFQAHINVEWCNKTNLMKYLFKYVTKGHDVARICFQSGGDAVTADSSSAVPVAATETPGASTSSVAVGGDVPTVAREAPVLAGRNEIDEYAKCRCVLCMHV